MANDVYEAERATNMDVTAFQSEDGTTFYYQTLPRRLYVIHEGDEIDAELPIGRIAAMRAHDNAVFFVIDEKFYKSVFSPSDGFTVSFLRDKYEDEVILRFAMCSRTINGKKYVYRIHDEEGIYVDLSEKELSSLELRSAHRGKAIYLPAIPLDSYYAISVYDDSLNTSRPTVHKLGRSAIIIEARYNVACIRAVDSCSYIYVSLDKKLHILDPRAMILLATFNFEIIPLFISGLYKREFTMKTVDKPIQTVDFWIGYYGNSEVYSFKFREDPGILKIMNIEQLPQNTEIFQKDDGTIYYVKRLSPTKLYIKSMEDDELEAKLPGDVSCFVNHNNDIYFHFYDEVYIIPCSSSDSLCAVKFRSRLEGETFKHWGMCKRIIDAENTSIYRIYDDPEKDGILIHPALDQADGLYLISSHRGKAVYVIANSTYYSFVTVRVIDNAIIIDTPSVTKSRVYCTDSSPFIYITISGREFYTLDTDSMEFFPPLQLNGVSDILHVAGVYNGQITVHAKKDNDEYMISAYLPPKYTPPTEFSHSHDFEGGYNWNLIENKDGDHIELRIKRRIVIPRYTVLCITDDGVIYYIELDKDYGSPLNLYLIWKGKKIYVDLPGKIEGIEQHGNAIYFTSASNTYKVVSETPGTATVFNLRCELENEKFVRSRCIRFRDGKTYVYRLCDDPYRDGILIDIPREELRKMEFRGIHRGKAVYFSENPTCSSLLAIKKLGQTYTVFDVSSLSNSFVCAREISPMIYFYFRKYDKVHAFNTRTMEFMPPLHISGLEIWNIFPFNETLAVHGRMEEMEHNYLIYAYLSIEYYDTASNEVRQMDDIETRHHRVIQTTSPILNPMEFILLFIFSTTIFLLPILLISLTRSLWARFTPFLWNWNGSGCDTTDTQPSTLREIEFPHSHDEIANNRNIMESENERDEPREDTARESPPEVKDERADKDADQIQLRITKKKLIPRNTALYITDDGMIYYCETGSPYKLYLIWKGEKVYAKLPGDLEDCETHGNAFYFSSARKAYKAVSETPGEITVFNLRYPQQDEAFYGSRCIRFRDGKTYVYRLCDDPERDGIIVDIPSEELDEMVFRGIHRGKAVYVAENPTYSSSLSIKKRGKTYTVFNVPSLKRTFVCTRDISPIIYFHFGTSEMHAFNTQTMEFMPSLHISGLEAIAGIWPFHENLAVHGRMEQIYLIYAYLPIEYYDTASNEVSHMDEHHSQPAETSVSPCSTHEAVRKVDDVKKSVHIDVLEILSNEPLPEQTTIFQTDEGTIYYLQTTVQRRLYVKYREEEITIVPPFFDEYCVYGTVGNAMYITIGEKVYKSFASPTEGMFCSSRRFDVAWEQSKRGFYTQLKNGKIHVCRVCDDPEDDGICIDVSEQELDGLVLGGVHRGKAIFHSRVPTKNRISARRLGRTVLVIEAPSQEIQVHARDCNRLIYITRNDEDLHTLDTDSLSFLHTLRLRDVCQILSVEGLQNDIITVVCEIGNVNHIVTARLPIGYYDTTTSYFGQPIAELEWTDRYGSKQSSGNAASFMSEFLQKFDPIAILGQGAFGCVFEAEFKLIRRRYAVKRIPLREMETDVQSALNEVLALDSFHHPGIVRYNHAWIEQLPREWQRKSDEEILSKLNPNQRDRQYEINTFAQHCSFLYIQMELCKSTIADWLKNHEERASKRLNSWFYQIVDAVDYVHRQDKMHRDLKPSNILIFSDDLVKLCDLGIATDIKNVGGTASWQTNVGSLIYKGPEQTFLYDHRVDIFALGLILIELCEKLSDSEKYEIFNSIRCGKQLSILQNQPYAFDLATKLTKLDRDERPTMTEILRHSFFL